MASLTKIYFLTILEAEILISGCQHGELLLRVLILTYRWLPSHCILMWPFLDVCMLR